MRRGPGPPALVLSPGRIQAHGMSTSAQHHDHLVQEDVLEELAWAPQVRESHVGVSVLDGVVTLSGEVDSCIERLEAEKAAMRVAGVTVVANDLVLRAGARFRDTDTDIAGAVKHVLDWSTEVPAQAVRAVVRDQVVTLSGSVPWNYQRDAAERHVRSIAGVLRIDNQVTLTPKVSADDTERRIEAALVRHALQDAAAITVTVVGSEATLTGHVGSWAEKVEAGLAAWSSPHVSAVHDKIVVRR
ncbi:MAG: BON domain-containing protein [Actinomycetales bacterium]|nr:MAG: BON domain-containing protein [Actinomycetales bacterium]